MVINVFATFFDGDQWPRKAIIGSGSQPKFNVSLVCGLERLFTFSGTL